MSDKVIELKNIKLNFSEKEVKEKADYPRFQDTPEVLKIVQFQ